MGRIRLIAARPLGKLLALLLLLGVAAGGTYAARGRTSPTETGPQQTLRTHAAPTTTATRRASRGARDRENAIANVLDVDVKIGQYHSDYRTYAGISAAALMQYSASYDATRYTVVATHGGKNFYVCSR